MNLGSTYLDSFPARISWKSAQHAPIWNEILILKMIYSLCFTPIENWILSCG